ncbi:unnamed protein product, partial [Iphiclides podalirius]
MQPNSADHRAAMQSPPAQVHDRSASPHMRDENESTPAQPFRGRVYTCQTSLRSFSRNCTHPLALAWVTHTCRLVSPHMSVTRRSYGALDAEGNASGEVTPHGPGCTLMHVTPPKGLIHGAHTRAGRRGDVSRLCGSRPRVVYGQAGARRPFILQRDLQL